MVPNDGQIASAMMATLAGMPDGVLSEECVVGLIAKPFVPTKDGTLPDDPFPTFSGYTPVSRLATAALQVIDPVTGRQTIVVPPPLGGWKFICDGAPEVPVTIYGYYLTMGIAPADEQAPVTASALFDQPIVIHDAGNYIIIPEVKLELVSVYMV